MADKKKERTILISPQGIGKFVWVDTPSTKFNADGKYSLDLLLDPQDEKVKTFLSNLEAAAKAAQTEAVKDNPKTKSYALHVPYSNEIDEDGNETGMVVVRFSNTARIKRKNPKPGEDAYWEKKIDRFDAGKKLLPAAVRIGRGSTLKAAFIMAPFSSAALKKHGLSLWLEAVQVLKLVAPGGGHSAESFGFGEEAGGYEFTEEQAAPDTQAEVPAGETPPDGDF